MTVAPGIVLVVDDIAADREFTTHALAGLGLSQTVVELQDGSEALDYLYCRGRFAGRARAAISFILLDLKMPKVDGFEVLRQIKGDAELAPIPVIVLSSSGETRDIEQSYRLGANAYVVKPMDFDDFVNDIQIAARFWATVNQPSRNV